MPHDLLCADLLMTMKEKFHVAFLVIYPKTSIFARYMSSINQIYFKYSNLQFLLWHVPYKVSEMEGVVLV